MKKAFVTLLVTLGMFACNTTDKKHSSLITQQTQAHVPEPKEDPVKLLAEAKLFISGKDYSKARERLSVLDIQFPHSIENVEGRGMIMSLNEEEAWGTALSSTETEATSKYMMDYPNGKYSDVAKSRFSELQSLKEKNDYEYALSQNTSVLWTKFLNDYPSRRDVGQTKERIIRAEVSEIMNDRETGQLPSSDMTGSGGSATSTVSIQNDTECDLTVRYSGSDAKMVQIPAGATRSLSLSSGSYKIAASACGYNYAGTESLQGSYSSSYYISTSRY